MAPTTEALREFGGVKELREESLRSALGKQSRFFYPFFKRRAKRREFLFDVKRDRNFCWVDFWSDPGIHRLEKRICVAFFVVFAEKCEKFIGYVCYIHPFSISSCWHLGGVFTPEISQLVGNIMGYLRWKETILHQSEIEITLQETNISHRGRRKIIFNSTFVGDMCFFPRGHPFDIHDVLSKSGDFPDANPMTDGIFSSSILREIGRRYSWILRDSQKGDFFRHVKEMFVQASSLSKHPHLDEGGGHHFSAFQYIKNHHLKMTPRFLDIYWCWFHGHILPSI